LSEFEKTFTLSNFESEQVKTTESPNEEQLFEMNEFTMENPSVKRGFTYDSENARNFDQANVNKAKEGVKEILKDTLEKAKRQAIEIKVDAQKEGYDAGFEEGFKKGEEAAHKEFSPFLETIQGLISDLTTFRKDMYGKVEREMIEMVVDLAKKIIHFEFSTRDNVVQEMIRLAVQSVLDRESMVIKINPADKEYAESFRPELHQLFSEIKNITFEAHTGVERGGCIVKTNFGVVDARIEKLEEQMDRILNLAPPPPEELVSESMRDSEVEMGATSEFSKDKESDLSAEQIKSEIETSQEDQNDKPSEEADSETQYPEETD